MNRIALGSLLLLSLTLRAQSAVAPTPAYAPQIDAVAQAALEKQKIPGLVVILVEGDRVTYSKGFGVASVETREPVTPDHLFRVGSTTKMMVAAAVVTLSQPPHNKLRLDEPVSRLLTRLNPKLADLTPSQLLSHTAGLMDRTLMYGAHDDTALAANVDSLQPDVLFTKPGSVYSYSNLGYAMAGRLIEAATDQPFADAMRDLVFLPLGMSRTTFRPTLAMTYPLAQGHIQDASSTELVIARPAADHSGYWPAGSMFTSGLDFSRMAIALLNDGRVPGATGLPTGTVKTMSTPRASFPGSGQYGYGLALYRAGKTEMIGHGGARQGYSSYLAIIPEKRTGVVILANRSGADPGPIAEKVLEAATGLKLSSGEPSPGASAQASLPSATAITGVYQNYTSIVTITADPASGNLLLRSNGRTAELGKGSANCYPMTPTGRVCFTLDPESGKARFVHLDGRAFARAGE